MPSELSLQVIRADQLPPTTYQEIRNLCDDAYGEDLSLLFAAYSADFHVLACLEDRPVGHAMVVTRWLQAGDEPMLRTASVEMVATVREYRNQGIGSEVMQKVIQAAADEGFQLAALCPGDTRLYDHL